MNFIFYNKYFFMFIIFVGFDYNKMIIYGKPFLIKPFN